MTDKGHVQKTILVVEDDPSIRLNVLEILQEEGYGAHGVENGEEALKYLRTTTDLPTLILLDLMMPVMNGWQFKIEQEQNSDLKLIPVVVVTADGNAHQKALNMNAAGWVKKPIEIDALINTIKSCCM